MARILILGGSGFIARHLVANFSRDSDTAIVLADLEPPLWEHPETVQFRRCDVRQPIDVGEFLPSLVINLAAVHRTPGHPDSAYHATNEAGAQNVVQFCVEREVKRVWFTSSIAVYGPTESPRDESSPVEPESAYGKSKVKAEEIHRDWATSQADAHLVIARPATVFGPGEGGNFTRLANTLASRTFFYPGRKDTVKACGYVGDLVNSFAHMERFATPHVTYNFAYPDAPTIQQICEAFHRAGGLPRPFVTVPRPLLMTAAKVLNRLGKADFDPRRVEKLVRSTNIVPNGLIDTKFDYETTLDSALARWLDSPPVGSFS